MEKEFLNNIQEDQAASIEPNEALHEQPLSEADAEGESYGESYGGSYDTDEEGSDSTDMQGDSADMQVDSTEEDMPRISDIKDYLGDLDALSERFAEMRGAADLSSLKNPLRYAALRDLGLSAEEAYLATSGAARTVRDNRMHLGGSVPRAAASAQSTMSARELREARELLGNIGDSEIIRLYKRVTSNI